MSRASWTVRFAHSGCGGCDTGTIWGHGASASLFSDPFLGRERQEQDPVNTGDVLVVGAQGMISKRGVLKGQTLYAQPT